MKQFVFNEFGSEHLELRDIEPPTPGPGEVAIEVRALSLNYRDQLVVAGHYNPRLQLPATPISDGAGVVAEIGPNVDSLEVGDRVVSHFVSDWQSGPFSAGYLATTLGTPGPGLAAERVVLPAHAVLPFPDRLDFAEASTLPIAALTAWSALVTEGRLRSTGTATVLTLGTGGVSIFALQLAKALGHRVIITSSSDDKLQRARALGADFGINYVDEPRWERQVMALTQRLGADVVVENGGVGTLSQSLRAVRAGGTVAMLGALTGLEGTVDIAPVLMKRVRIAGVLVDSRESFEAMLEFMSAHPIEPVIDHMYEFEELPTALTELSKGRHFGKIVLELREGER